MRFLVLALFAATSLPVAAAAQSNLEGRVGKLESEMRAVQRKVFPGGAGQLVLPDVTAQAPAGPVPGAPATSAVADLTSRVAALEGQVASMTGQVEQTSYRLRQLQDAFEAYRRANDARVGALATPAPAAAAPATGAGAEPDDEPAPARGGASRPGSRPAPASSSAATPTVASAAVAKPSTGDAPEDEYLYGYRLWAAKKYPEAEAQLKKVVADYPKHRRASYAQNLLGRSYLDDGKPSLASMAFYDNYKKMPEGERAPDSLYYLGTALLKLNKPADACKVYGELTEVYGDKISAAMKANVARDRATAKCK